MTADRVLLVDFETRSKADLKKIGGRKYSEHPSTEVLCAVFHDPDEGWLEWCPPVYDPPLADARTKSQRWAPTRARQEVSPGFGRIPLRLAFARCDIPVVAHNGAGFDRHIWARLGWPEPPRWIDTAELARRGGMPQASLDYLAKALLGLEKDEEGNKLTIKLSRVRPKDTKAGAKRGDYYTPIVPVETLARVVQYCRSDVEILARLWAILQDWDDVEARVLEVDRIITDRGILLDTDLAKTLLAFDEWQGDQAVQAAAEVCQDPEGPPRDWAKVVSSPAQLAAELNRLGAFVPNAQRDTIEPLAKHEDPRVASLATARLALSSIAAGKLEAGLARVSWDQRLRDTLKAYGAHTWRWAGQGMQLHNLPKGLTLPRLAAGKRPGLTWREVDALIEADIQDFLAGRVDTFTAAHIPTLLRACLCAPPGRVLVVADYSSVEARGLAWAAEDSDALAGFRTPGYDPYRALAGKLFGVDPKSIPKDDWRRQLGKKAELGLGYQMGPDKFEATAAEDGVDWAMIQRDYGLTPTKVVYTWRDVHAPIVDFWHDTQAAAVAACSGRSTDVGPFSWSRVGEDVWCWMPAGRPIVYHRMHTVRGERGPDLRYLGREGLEYTYGGKLTENLIQGHCRDLLAAALVEAEDAGLCPVLHVHDEAAGEADENQAEDALHLLEDIMSTAPAWSAGMPLGAEGWCGRRYRK